VKQTVGDAFKFYHWCADTTITFIHPQKQTTVKKKHFVFRSDSNQPKS